MYQQQEYGHYSTCAANFCQEVRDETPSGTEYHNGEWLIIRGAINGTRNGRQVGQFLEPRDKFEDRYCAKLPNRVKEPLPFSDGERHSTPSCDIMFYVHDSHTSI